MNDFKQLIMLNLYRGGFKEEEEKQIVSVSGNKGISECYSMDYFDYISLEKLKWSETRLADCMGIDRQANQDKPGISHQRYCLYGDGNNLLFEKNDKYPVITLIQVFINPEIYQFDKININEQWENPSCKGCINGVNDYLKDCYENSDTLRWGIYSLITEGDFMIVVRSCDFHTAYDISSLVRNIQLRCGKERNTLFFTYSITGIFIGEHSKIRKKQWSDLCKQDDKIILRIQFSQTFRMANSRCEKIERNEILEFGERLFGRYDYQIECSWVEFGHIYPHLLKFKIDKSCTSSTDEKKISKKAKRIIWMLRKGYIDHVNEKLLLKYDSDQFVLNNTNRTWDVRKENRKWMYLYDRNREEIFKLQSKSLDVERQIKQYYNYERNLKEYTRLLGRLCRIFFEMNKLVELRVSLAVLIMKYNVFLDSIQRYLSGDLAMGKSEVASVLNDNLRMGINTLEIYIRYIRNVNLQTLQTPNYELQTNVSVEKILLSYSQFLMPFVKKGNRYYELSQTYLPVVVPVTDVRDLSVAVMFDEVHEETKSEVKKLMLVNSPTFLAFCESCFLIPILFHEIAHQFRYESQEIRNTCLKKYILKSFLFNILVKVLNLGFEYNMEMDKMIEGAVNDIYPSLKEILDIQTEVDLNSFRYEIWQALCQFSDIAIENGQALDFLVKNYIERTSKNICRYDQAMVDAVDRLVKAVENWKSIGEDDHANCDKYTTVVKYFEKLNIQQKKQLLELIHEQIEELNEKGHTGNEKLLHKFLKHFEAVEKKELTNTINDADREKLFVQWNDYKSDGKLNACELHIENLLKKYHNHVIVWRDTRQKMDEEIALYEYSVVLKVREWIKSADDMLKRNLELCIEKRDKELSWSASTVTVEILEEQMRKIKMMTPDDREKEWGRVLRSVREKLGQHVDSITEIYREVTSDLFMCAIMGLEGFGYLVVVAEYIELREENEEGVLARVFWVLQCLAREYEKENSSCTSHLNMDKYLYTIMEEQVRILERHMRKKYSHMLKNEGTLEDIEKYLNSISYKMAEENDANENTKSTRKWIIRIYRKIAALLLKMKERRLSYDVIGEKDMWDDIIHGKSYMGRKSDIQNMIKENDKLLELCEGITSILNCPANFYNDRKSLLEQEIQFIFHYYEECCKSIWKEEEML